MAKTLTDIPGVFASGIHVGIKKENKSKKDLAFVYVPNAVACAGVFTKNKFRAPCLDYSKAQIDRGVVKAVIVNSGNANAATGKQGYQNAARTAESAAKMLSLKPEEVSVASTGIIGVQLPLNTIELGLKTLLSNPQLRDGHSAAEAIITTDLCTKEVYLEKQIAGQTATIAGFAKGSGMIAPNMGTMLAFLVTDIHIEQTLLQELLSSANEDSFNMISVDTDTSTNDMVLLFSTGENKLDLSKTDIKRETLALLREACIDLAKKIARDGEGAEKLIEAHVGGAVSKTEAKKMALNIINSPLIKTAIHGADPNWGRVMMAVGKDPELNVDPTKVDLFFSDQQILSRGEILPFDRSSLVKILKEPTVNISVNLNLGDYSATAWGCDLTMGYVKINTDYS